MKYSLLIFKNKNLFKRQKYPSPNTLNIKYFEHSPITIMGFGVSLKYPIFNFKKTVCPKNVWMQHSLLCIRWQKYLDGILYYS